VLLPLLLLILALLAATIVAYGTHPAFAQFSHGLSLILFSRQYQWPLLILSLLLCLTLIALVVAGKRRAWWLIGLAPITALFIHRYVNDPVNQVSVAEGPAFVPATGVGRVIQNDDYVVGLKFGDDFYAYPYAALYSTPVVVQDQHEKRLVVIWSAYANRAVATMVSREVRARDLAIVSVPANALLLYNGRVGQFVNGLTGLTPTGAKPTGFSQRVATVKTTWKAWRDLHPETKIMLPARALAANTPRTPVRPKYPMPPLDAGKLPPETWTTVVGTTQPSAVRTNDVGVEPLNLYADRAPVLLFRDGSDGPAKAFSRQLDADTTPRFELVKKPKKPGARYVDRDTESGWDVNGVAIYGPPDYKGKHLAAVPVEDDLYWGVMKFWYPGLEYVELPAAEAEKVTPAPVPERQPVRRARGTRRR